MKTRLLGLALFFCVGLLKAQVVDLKDFFSRLQTDDEDNVIEVKDGMYIKDISGVMTPFLGTWSGCYKDYAYLISISKGMFYGKKTLFKSDCPMYRYQVYKRDQRGDWYIVEEYDAYVPKKGVNFLVAREYRMSKTKPYGSYDAAYEGNSPKAMRGYIIFSPLRDRRMEFYLMNNPNYPNMEEEHQIFPYWFKEAGITNTSYLHRIGEPGALLLERPRYYDKILYYWGVLSPMLKMQKDALFMLEGKSYVPLLDIRLLNKLRYDAGGGLPAMYDGYPQARYGYATLLEGEGGEGELGERNLAYRLHYMSDVMELKGAKEEAIHALNFKQLLHVAMLEHLARELLTDAEVSAMLYAERELYEYDFPHVLKVYAQKRGISLEELKRHCLADAERLFTAQRLPSISKAKQELKTLLDRGY